MKKILMLLLLSSCAFDPAITKRAGERRVAGSRLASCLRSPPGRPWNEEQCKAESKAYCVELGHHPTCAFDDAFWELQSPDPLRRYR